MSNMTFYPSRASEGEANKIYGQFSIGSAGTPSGLQGNGVASVSETATGVYKLTLTETGFKFLNGVSCLVSAAVSAKTARTGESAVQTATFADVADTDSADHIVITDTDGNLWGVSLDKTGSDLEPTGPIWASIAAGRKVHVDISGATTGADVAAAVETAVDALTGFTALITTADTGADLAFTHVYRAPVAALATYNSDESADGTTTVAETNTGVQTTVDVTANSIAIASHGYQTGRLVALSIDSGTLPAGTSATNYYVIRVDANTVKLASSLANAEAGTAVDITDYGTEAKIMTLTPALAGSGVACVEIGSETVASSKEIVLNCYDFAGALVQPANGTVCYFELTVRNSSVPRKGE